MATYRSFHQDSTELRQHERFMTPEGTMVILSPGFDKEWTVQAIDISLGGVAFVYQGERQDLDKSGVLKILAKNVDFKNLGYQTAHDETTSQSQEASVPFRRRGVRFLWEGNLYDQDLAAFIISCSP